MYFEKLHRTIGAKVQGIDLSILSDDNISEINNLWLKYLILLFPNQDISDKDHIRFGRKFGQLEKHPSLSHRSSKNPEIYRVSNVSEEGKIIPSKNTSWQYLKQSWLWHTDSSFREIPSKGSILHGISTTRKGGSTYFANMYEAYNDLDKATKESINNLWVIHDHDYIINLSAELKSKQNKGSYEHLPPVKHPLVQTHPVTRKKSLFLSPHTMVNVDGFNEIDGRNLLDELIDHSVQSKYVYKHEWTDNDIIMWDNRCTMHSVEPFDNNTIKRIMHRVTLVGENKPIPVE